MESSNKKTSARRCAGAMTTKCACASSPTNASITIFAAVRQLCRLRRRSPKRQSRGSAPYQWHLAIMVSRRCRSMPRHWAEFFFEVPPIHGE